MRNHGHLTDAEIRARIDWLEADAGVSEGERVYYAKYLADYRSGEIAENAVRRLVRVLGPDSIELLVRAYVIGHSTPPAAEHCRSEQYVMECLRTRHGMGVDLTDEGWTVTLRDGTVVSGERLCQPALIAVWLQGMRARLTS